MRRLNMRLAGTAAVLALSVAAANAQETEGGDRTLSPYFLVKGGSDTEQLPLKSTGAKVNIAGVIADVLVTQIYQNTGRTPIEAVYVFPASTRAAVSGMKMTIGERVIEAKIKKREEARQEYEKARDEGKNASLLEQQRPNVFQMNVANIMPGDEIRVELRYTELIVPTDRVYEFAYPTVVGPRYSTKQADSAPASERWVKNPHLHQGEPPPYAFDIGVNLMAGVPISDISCDTHRVNTSFSGPGTASVTLDGSETSGGNRDFILRYRLDGAKVQTGLLLLEGERENFFLLMMQPPARVENAAIPGREYIFIVDISGSMHGFPLEVSKELLRNLIGGLRPTDLFNVLLFAGSSSLMAPESVPATQANIENAIRVIDHQRGGGGTELLPALNRALSLKKPENYSRTIVIATDGYVNVEAEAFDVIRSNLGRANMFAFGIGSAVNRHLIEGMAHAGMGEPFVVTRQDQARGQAEKFRKMIASPVLTNVKVSFDGLDVYDVEPPSVPDVLAERPVVVFGKWRGRARGSVTLSGVTGSGRHGRIINIADAVNSKENGALRHLWARHRIQILSDFQNLKPSDERVKQVTELGLNYGLLTNYTSFVAVDSLVRNRDGKSTTVKQPLPLPEGVTDYAVGGSVAAAPAATGFGYGRGGGTGSGMLKMMTRTAAESSPIYARKEARCDRTTAPDKAGAADGDAKKKAPAAARVAGLAVSGPLSEGAVRGVVESRLVDLRHCLAKGGLTDGGLVVKLVIGGDGKVREAKVLSGLSQEASFARWCMEGMIGKWVFGAGASDTEIMVTLEPGQ